MSPNRGSGRGNAGAKGGPAGDLLIAIEEIPHEELTREGSNVVFELYLNFADAALGSKVDVPTLDGRARITVPAGTQSGKVFRLKDKGLPALQSYGRGDQLVHISVWMPKKLNDEARQVLEKMRDMPNLKPSPDKEEKGFFERVRDMFE